jgi:HEAT repeat protein
VKPLARRLPNAPESDRRSIIRALGELGDANALPALRDACKAWPGNRADAAMAMHRLGDPNGTRIFRTQFTSSDWETRRKALEALHTTEYKEFWEQAIACVDDPAASIRIYAMLLLKDLRDSNAIPALREALRADPLPFLRARAAEALAELGDRESLPLIRKRFLATRLSQARFHYAAALGKLDPANGIPLIASRLPKLPRAYQFALISRFDEFDTPHAFKALQKLAQSRDPHLRDSAEWALSCIRRKRAAAKAAKQKAE